MSEKIKTNQPKSKKQLRDEKLAKALRDNLRRRKETAPKDDKSEK